ncbi:MAG: hypothetical protein NT009_13925 [Proteobacteria bacterium]|nr:hypothetical protein [Pseudomonadota bacterium]
MDNQNILEKIRRSINSVISEFDHTLKMNGYTVKQNDDSINISLAFCHENNTKINFSISFSIDFSNQSVLVNKEEYPENGRSTYIVTDVEMIQTTKISIDIFEEYLRKFIEKALRKSLQIQP